MENNTSKNYFIRTFGCQMNIYDSVLISESLENIGYNPTDDMEKAELILFNTCTIRGLSEHKAMSELGATKQLKENNPNILIGIVGCVAQQLGKSLIKKYPFVDFVLGTKDMYKIPELIKTYNNVPVVETDMDYNVAGYKLSKYKNVSSYITIVRGCTFYCSYCIVPYVRGKEVSREIQDIVKEAKVLADNGVKELVLLGQNVNVYGEDIKSNLEDLLLELNEIKEIKRLRYITSHPESVNQKFIETIKNIPKVCEHIHIPFQTGSNKILKSMNRRHTREEYIEKVNMIRSIIPNISITADVIVGYPLEEESDFLDTISLLEECKLDNIYSFKYSPRKGTSSYKQFKNDLPQSIKEERLARLNKIEGAISKKTNEALIGTTQEVLWENSKTYHHEQLLEGRTRTFKKVFAPFKENRIGELENVKIDKVTNFSLIGTII